MTQLPLLFLPDVVILPGMVVPIELDEAAQAAVDAAQATESHELLVAPRLDDRYASYGVVATIEKVGRFSRGGPAAVLRAGVRAEIGSGVTGPGAALWVEATPVEPSEPTEHARELASEYQKLVVAVLQRREAWQIIDQFGVVDRPRRSSPTRPAGRRTSPTSASASCWRRRTSSDRLRAAHRVDPRAPRRGRGQRQDRHGRPRGHGEERSASSCCASSSTRSARSSARASPTARTTTAPGSRRPTCPTAVRDGAAARGRQARALQRPEPRGRLDPHLARHRARAARGTTATVDSTDVDAARAVLDADHHGLDEVKDRIVEYLAVRARRASRGLEVVGGRGSGAVILLAGPPGVGKTSLGESVARTLGRKFVRVALGGVRDEAEIRGHRRTYVGALPGRIVRAIKEAGSMNPVVLLDEVDKVGADYRGDPAAALLEVLDPAQNHTFRDHYLELDLDLSDVLFIATANVVETIPPALLDRMELVTLDGYTEDDKVAIARDFLVPAPARAGRADADEVDRDRRGAARDRRQLHPRGRRTPARAAARQGVPQGGDEARDRRRRPRRRSTAECSGPDRPAAVHARTATSARRARASRPGSP